MILCACRLFFFSRIVDGWVCGWVSDISPKVYQMCLFDGGNEIIDHPQWKYDELPKSIKTYDGLSGGFSTNLIDIGVTL